MTEDYRASVLAAKERKASSAPLVLRRLRDFACAINPGPWPRPTWILPPMLAAAPSPRGSDADLSIVGYVVGGSMTSRCLHAMPHRVVLMGQHV